MNFKAAIAEEIVRALGESPFTAEEIAGILEVPPDTKLGDFAFPCFRLSKALRKSPMMRGEDVTRAQQRLAYHHADPGSIDGIFGDRTKAAVLRFQRARAQEGRDIGAVDGIIGQKTWAILWE